MHDSYSARRYVAGLLSDPQLSDEQIFAKITQIIVAGLNALESRGRDTPASDRKAYTFGRCPNPVSASAPMRDTEKLTAELNARVAEELAGEFTLVPDSVNVILNKAHGDVETVLNALTIAASYHESSGGINNLPGFLCRVIDRGTPASIADQAAKIRLEGEPVDSEWDEVMRKSMELVRKMQAEPPTPTVSLLKERITQMKEQAEGKQAERAAAAARD